MAAFVAIRKSMRRGRVQREKHEAHRARAAEAARIALERVAIAPRPVSDAVPEPMPESLSGVISTLENSVRFARLQSPAVE